MQFKDGFSHELGEARANNFRKRQALRHSAIEKKEIERGGCVKCCYKLFESTRQMVLNAAICPHDTQYFLLGRP